jgi:hypothetical protein
MDWTGFWLATTAAATVATAISTGAVLWLRRRERPEPDWVVWAYASWPNGSIGGKPIPELQADCTLVNGGDGAAFLVTLKGDRCKVGLPNRAWPTEPLVGPGGSFKWWISVLPDDFDRAVVTVTWTRPPTRLKKQQTVRYPLPELMTMPPDTRERPALTPPGQQGASRQSG